MSEDPFDTAGIRRRVLRGWIDQPVRLREDANAEEDHARGGYRDRVVIELAQNAADAAARAGIDGRLWLRLDADRLTAANTGAPLDPAAVLCLATLRASAKRADEDGDTVGRFGVGFSAVLAVSDRPAVVGHRHGVRFDGARTLDLVTATGNPALLAEIARRGGRLPVLRLPFDVDLERSPGERLGPPDGYDTQVTLPLRDAAAHALVQRLLAELDEALLLALPSLHEIRIDVAGASRVVTRRSQQWHLVRREGRFTAAQLADRPTEEQQRPGWHLTWALPVAGPTAGGGVLHAPTPTDEPLDWPALLIATFPLEPSRRRIAPGPAAEALVVQAAAAYADLVTRQAAAGEPIWRLLPVGLPAPGLDAALRAAALDELRRHPILPGADGSVVRPLDAVAVDGAGADNPQVTAVLAAAVPGLVTAPRSAAAGLRWLGVGTTSLADAVEQLPVPGTATGWIERYRALAVVADDAAGREALAALAVPLEDGRVVRGARGLVIADGVSPAVLSGLGVRVVAAAAAHPLLHRLGAEVVTAERALDLPEVRAAVARVRELLDGDPDEAFGRQHEPDQDGPAHGEPEQDVTSAVLSLVASTLSGGAAPDGAVRPWLVDLMLHDEDDEPAPAGELVLPGSPAERWLDPEAFGVVSHDLVEQWGPAVLTAVGVVSTLSVSTTSQVPLVEDGARLADWSQWAAEGRDRLVEAHRLALDDPDLRESVAVEVAALPDLDAVVDPAWPDVLHRLATDPRARAAVVRPTRLLLGGPAGPRQVDVPSWSAWWLRGRLFDGRAWADPTAAPWLHAVLGAPGGPARAPLVEVAGLDPQLRRALGSVATPAELAEAGAGTLAAVLERLADPDVEVTPPQLLTLWAVLARAGESLGWRFRPDPSGTVRALRQGGVVLVPVERAVVVDGPMWLQRHDLGAMVVAPPERAEALADLLDLAVADEVAPGRVDGDPGVAGPVGPAVTAVLDTAVETWFEHDDLTVDGHHVDWWVEPDGAVHACTLEGLARALAWAGGCWGRRHVVLRLLTGPESLGELVDVAFE